MSYYGPPMPPQFPLPQRRPRGPKPQGKKPAAAKPAPKALSEQQKTTVAKTTMAKHHSIPMPQMDSANKASLADEDCRIQLTQKELDMVYHSVVSSLNSGHGYMNVQIGGPSVNSVRLYTKIKIKLPNSVAAKLHKNHIYRHHAADVQPTAEDTQELDEDGNPITA